MRTLIVIFFALTGGQLSAQAPWHLGVRENREREKTATISYNWSEDRKTPPSTNGLAEILASRDKTIPIKHVNFWHYFNNDPIIQQELLEQFQATYPELLAGALKSSGNMHNPKVLPLREKISECLPKTPTLVKLGKLFADEGLEISGVDFEKFWIDKTAEKPKFHAIIWLIVSPKTDDKKADSPCGYES